MRGSPVCVTVGAAVAVRATFGRKGLLYRRHICAQMHQHMPDHRIILDQQMIRLDLAGCVPVSDMPCQLYKVRTCNPQQRLIRRNDRNHPPLLRLEGIAMVKRDRLGQIHQHALTVRCPDHLAAQEPRIIAQLAGGKRRVPCACGMVFLGDMVGHVKPSLTVL